MKAETAERGGPLSAIWSGPLSVVLTGALMLALGALAGTLGFTVMLFAAVLLLVPALVILLVIHYFTRRQDERRASTIGAIAGGWALAAAIAIIAGSLIAWAPTASYSPFTLDPVWAAVTPICALVGILIGTALEAARFCRTPERAGQGRPHTERPDGRE